MDDTLLALSSHTLTFTTSCVQMCVHSEICFFEKAIYLQALKGSEKHLTNNENRKLFCSVLTPIHTLSHMFIRYTVGLTCNNSGHKNLVAVTIGRTATASFFFLDLHGLLVGIEYSYN